MTRKKLSCRHVSLPTCTNPQTCIININISFLFIGKDPQTLPGFRQFFLDFVITYQLSMVWASSKNRTERTFDDLLPDTTLPSAPAVFIPCHQASLTSGTPSPKLDRAVSSPLGRHVYRAPTVLRRIPPGHLARRCFRVFGQGLSLTPSLLCPYVSCATTTLA